MLYHFLFPNQYHRSEASLALYTHGHHQNLCVFAQNLPFNTSCFYGGHLLAMRQMRRRRAVGAKYCEAEAPVEAVLTVSTVDDALSEIATQY